MMIVVKYFKFLKSALSADSHISEKLLRVMGQESKFFKFV